MDNPKEGQKSDKAMYRSAVMFMALVLIVLYFGGLLTEGLVGCSLILTWMVWDLTRDNR